MLGRLGLALSVLGVGLVAATALLGHSAAVAVRSGGGFPPYALNAHPSAGLVTALLITATMLAAAGLLAGWFALRAGWAPPPGPLVLAGVAVGLALTLLPHVCTADPESYAAYGRMTVVGLDPYDTEPAALAARGDAYGALVESPWQHSPSVYGPVATAEAQLAARIAGPDDPRTAVWLLGLWGGLAFALTGLLLHRLAGDDGGARRVAVLWTCNPLLLFQLVAGAHVDTIAIVGVVGALALVRRTPFGAGLLGGAAVAVKLPAALVGGGLAWALRRSPRRLVALAAGALVALAAAYVPAGAHAFDQTRTASRYVSRATPWRPLRSALEDAWGHDAARVVVLVLSLALAVGLAVVLARRLPTGRPAYDDDPLPSAVRAALALTMAWLFAAPYALPWYDGIAWALIVLLAASRFDLLLLAHTTVLSLAYIPGRDVPLPGAVDAVASALRSGLAPAVLGLVVVATAGLAATRRQADRVR